MSQETDEIKNRIDIADLVSDYVELKPAGTNQKGLCPFHQEKTPSFMVSSERGSWHCFGCNKGGDIFSFLQEIEHIEFPEALRILAERAGVELKQYTPRVATDKKTRLIELHRAAIQFFSSKLTSHEGTAALEYLTKKRKLSQTDIDTWQLGYAPDSWRSVGELLQRKGFTKEEIHESGLSIVRDGRHEYDRFRNRITFPIYDTFGNPIAFTGRQMNPDEGAKYINSPQTLLYDKSHVLYGLHLAKSAIREKRAAIFVEGNMDVIASHRAGIKNAVAVSGTALTQSHLDILKRLTSTLFFAFDADTAGIRAAARALELALKNEFLVKAIVIDPALAKDPGELVEKNPEQWGRAVEHAVPFMDFLIDTGKRVTTRDIGQKKILIKRFVFWLSKIVDPIEQSHFISRVSAEFDVERQVLIRLIQNAGTEHKTSRTPATQEKPVPTPHQPPTIQETITERLLALLITGGSPLEYATSLLTPPMLPERYRPLYKLIVSSYTIHKTGWSSDTLFANISQESPDLAPLMSALVLLGEDIRNQIPEAERVFQEVKTLTLRLCRTFLIQERKERERSLREAERSGNQETTQFILVEIQRLTHAITRLDSERAA